MRITTGNASPTIDHGLLVVGIGWLIKMGQPPFSVIMAAAQKR